MNADNGPNTGRCASAWCKDTAAPGSTLCLLHQPYDGLPNYRSGEAPRLRYELNCFMCGRSAVPGNGFLRMTEAEARIQRYRLEKPRCVTCGGRVMLTPADVGSVSSPQSEIPTRLDTRPGYKVAR